MTRVLTVGETMALLDPVVDGELRYGDALTLRIAGAESNFAIALARLGVDVTWVSRVERIRSGGSSSPRSRAKASTSGQPSIRPRRRGCS